MDLKYMSKVMLGNVEGLKENCKRLKLEMVSLETVPDLVHFLMKAE
jgi:hypothetical protein